MDVQEPKYDFGDPAQGIFVKISDSNLSAALRGCPRSVDGRTAVHEFHFTSLLAAVMYVSLTGTGPFIRKFTTYCSGTRSRSLDGRRAVKERGFQMPCKSPGVPARFPHILNKKNFPSLTRLSTAKVTVKTRSNSFVASQPHSRNSRDAQDPCAKKRDELKD